MWILEAIPEIPIRKPLLVLLTTLGAGFLLLARLLHFNPLFHPVIYAVIALDFYLLHTDHRIWRGLIAIPSSYLLAYWLLPDYILLFSAAFTLLIGKVVYSELFRIWKWGSAAALFAGSIFIVSVWQQIPFLNQLIPWQMYSIVHGALFAFCLLCSFLPYRLKKDAVQDAMEHYNWKRPSEVASMVQQTYGLYTKLRLQVSGQKTKDELMEFCERLIHLCFRLQEIQTEICGADLNQLQQQIQQLESKVQSVKDPLARKQYEHALSNKLTQLRQQEAIRNQAERIRAQVLNYISALENMQFAYANQHFSSSSESAESLDFFLHMTSNRAENIYETSEAYQKLLSE